jgi:hypothetical protein
VHLPKIREDAFDVIERVGPLGMTRQLHAPPSVRAGLVGCR